MTLVRWSLAAPHAVVAPVVLAALVACRDAPRGTPASAPAVARRFAQEPVDTTWASALPDSLLVSPAFLAVDATQAYLSDPGARAVHAFDLRTGQRRWTTPIGGETVPRSIAGLREGGVAIADERSGAVVLLDPTGRERGRVTSPDVHYAASVCELPDRAFLLAGVNHTAGLAVLERTGRVRRAVTLPWPDLHEALTASAWLTASRDGCVAALTYGRGFAAFVGDGFARPARYVEYFDVPSVVHEVRRARDSVITTTQVAAHRVAATDVAADDSLLAVSFEGETGDRAHVVDYYALPDGRYVESRRLARRALAMTMHGGLTIVLSRTPAGYELVAWRAARTR
jgi:hypothetical protein